MTPRPEQAGVCRRARRRSGRLCTLNIPPNADPATIAAAIEATNLARAEAAKRESEALATLFHLPDLSKSGLS